IVSHTIRRRSKLAETRRRPSGLTMSGQGVETLAGLRVPDHHAPTPAPGREPPAIEAEGHADRSLFVSGETAEELAVPPVPEVHHPLIPRRQPPAVWAEGHAIGRPIVDADESGAPEDLVACRQVPDPHLPIRARSGHVSPFGVERHGVDEF